MGKSIQLPDALLIIFAQDPEVVEIDMAFYNQEVGLTSFLTSRKAPAPCAQEVARSKFSAVPVEFKPRSNSTLPKLMPAGASRCRSINPSRARILG